MVRKKNRAQVKAVIMTPYLTGHGGMETVLVDVMNAYRFSQKVNLNVYFSQGIGTEDFLNSLYDCSQVLNRLNAGDQTFAKKLLNVIKTVFFLANSNTDEIICMGTRLNRLAKLVRKIFRKKYTIVSWIHFSLIGGDVVSVNAVKAADYHLAISKGIKRQLIDMGVAPNRISVVYNPIDVNVSVVADVTVHDPATFLYIGRIQWKGQKNLQELFNALRRLHGNWQLIIVGSGEDQELRQFISKFHLEQNVKLLGWQNDPWTKIKTVSCSVLSSKFEGLPMGIIESLTRGIPCVASDCPTGPADLIRPMENGFLYRMGDVPQLTHFLQKFVDKKVNFNHADIKEKMNWLNSDKYYQNFTSQLLRIEAETK